MAIATLLLGGGFIFLLLRALGTFYCFDKEVWKEEPIANCFRLIAIIIALIILTMSVVIAFRTGESPFGTGDHYYPEQWEPAW